MTEAGQQQGGAPMGRVVVFGAGLVAGAHVRYLLEHGCEVTVASRTVSKAHELLAGHPKGQAIAFDIEREGDDRLAEIVAQHDVAVSLLPYVYHARIGRVCVQKRRHMVTTSYVQDAMRALDEPARAAGVTLLNEIGVDPGIDHMTAMRIIHRVQREGGQILSFISHCGGLPAPEANTNPLGYKFSWSPRGVLLAGRNAARYRRDGRLIEVPGESLFDHRWPVRVPVDGQLLELEGYPNRDSLPYAELYGIASAETVLRGTLRYPGWCETLSQFARLGLLDDRPIQNVPPTWAQFLAHYLGAPTTGDLRTVIAQRLGVSADSRVLAVMEWLGLLDETPVADGCTSPLDLLTAAMLAKMRYEPGERDMIILEHQFVAQYPDHRERILSRMIDFGIPYGDTAMNRTVGLPAAVAVRLILEGAFRLPGVVIPVMPELYNPVLAELEALGLRFSESVTRE